MRKIVVYFFVLILTMKAVWANEGVSNCFPITKVSLIGEGADQFQFALSPILNELSLSHAPCMGGETINQILHRVQNKIIKKGYITTRVVLVPQDLKAGELKLVVIPGRISAIQVDSKVNPCHTVERTLPFRSGDLLNLRHIEQGLEQFKRLPTVEANIEIEPTHSKYAEKSESDLIIHYQQHFPLRLDISVDDAGSKASTLR